MFRNPRVNRRARSSPGASSLVGSDGLHDRGPRYCSPVSGTMAEAAAS